MCRDIPEKDASFFREFYDFLMENKIWWITPIVLILLLVIGFIVYTTMFEGESIPFFYTIF